MNPIQIGNAELWRGDVFACLAEMPDESVNCIVTSPPYWGLRDYGVEGQLGMEPSLGEHIDVMVRVCRELRRVLRKDGTFWLNYGDCYNGYMANQRATSISANNQHARPAFPSGHGPRDRSLKPKDLCMIPNRLAIALQDDGWWVRQEIIWAKKNPMPESTQDRPTSSHEKLWLLTKSARYWYDAEAVRTEAVSQTTKMPDGWDTGPGAHGSVHRNGREKGAKPDKQSGHSRRHDGFNDRWDAMDKEEQQANGANLRNVWHIATQPFPEAHFATFPEKLVEPCIKAGCPEGGLVLDPFGGSGTVGVVAHKLNRRALLIELNPEYIEIARRRLEAATRQRDFFINSAEQMELAP